MLCAAMTTNHAFPKLGDCIDFSRLGAAGCRKLQMGGICPFRHPNISPTAGYCYEFDNSGGNYCKRGLMCPFKHSKSRQSVCAHYLNGTCSRIAAQCAFAHKPLVQKQPRTILPVNLSHVTNSDMGAIQNQVVLGYQCSQVPYAFPIPQVLNHYHKNRFNRSSQFGGQGAHTNFNCPRKFNKFSDTDARELTPSANKFPTINPFRNFDDDAPSGVVTEYSQESLDKNSVNLSTTRIKQDIDAECAKLRAFIIAKRKDREKPNEFQTVEIAQELSKTDLVEQKNKTVEKLDVSTANTNGLVPGAFGSRDEDSIKDVKVNLDTTQGFRESSSKEIKDDFIFLPIRDSPHHLHDFVSYKISPDSRGTPNDFYLPVSNPPPSPETLCSSGSLKSKNTKRNLDSDSVCDMSLKKPKIEKQWSLNEDQVDWGSDVEDD